MTDRKDPSAPGTMTLDQALKQAVALHQAGDLAAAEALYRAILQAVPGQPDANHNLGLLAVHVGQPAGGLPFLEAALQGDGGRRQFWFSYAEALSLAGREEDAVQVLGVAEGRGHGGVELEALRVRLDGAVRTRMAELVALFEQGRFAAGEAAAWQFLRDRPAAIFGWKSLGLFLQAQGRAAASLSVLRTAIALDPGDAEACVNYGNARRDLRESSTAAGCYRRALTINPDFALAERNLASTCRDLNQLPKAKIHCLRAIQANPADAEARNTLGVILRDMDMNKWREAEANYRLALCLQPGFAEAWFNLGFVSRDQGAFSIAETHFRRAVVLRPTYLEAQSNLLFTMNYGARHEPAVRSAEARRFGRNLAAQIARYDEPGRTVASRPSRLRVGVVSGDLRRHAVAFFLENLLANIDPDRLELIAYPTATADDDVTSRLRPFFAGWRSIAELDDDAAARLVRADGVHVLLDLSGHTGANRLAVFGRRPAPLQVSWLGYCATTGVAEMDYFLADPFIAPVQDEALYTERVWRLPESFLCFTPPEFDLAVGSLPAVATGHVTFGSFNNLAKVNETVIDLWSRVLRQVPGARLLLKAGPFDRNAAREKILAEFVGRGIAADRLMLEGVNSRPQLLKSYHRVDIALDTFPYAGGTTSVEALWMGVPFVTLRGASALARMGDSIACNAGLSDWVAADGDDYVALCSAWAGRLDRLASLRAGLRHQVMASPLFDSPRFARHFEAALWGMWTARQGKD